MNVKRNLVLGGIMVLVAAGVATADDVQPPWWRGQWSTTYQYWEFSTDQTENVKPDGPGPLIDDPVGPPYEQPGYLESTEIVAIDGYWAGEDTKSDRQGIWALSGTMDVLVDNHEPQNEWKIMWVQITWRPHDIDMYPILENFIPAPDPAYLPRVVQKVDLECGWYETTFTWRIPCNPPEESFRIAGNIDVDELVIDTWCIPEPATMVLLSVGGMALIRRRRK